MVKTINISINEKSLEIIDKASKKDNRSRSNFLEQAGLEKAKQMEAMLNAKQS